MRITSGAACLVLALVLLPACGSGGTETVTVAGEPETVVETETDTDTETITETETVTETETIQAKPKPKPKPRSGRSFSGNGSQTLAPVVVRSGGQLRWTCQGGIIIYDDSFTLSVTSDASSGQSYVPAGTYRGVEVSCFGGPWKVTFPR